MTIKEDQNIQSRKREHLECCLKPRARTGKTELDSISLPYDALFEVSDDMLNTSSYLGQTRLKFPLMFSAMTGGIPSVTEFNTTLRKLASVHGLGLCLGSIKACLKDSALIPTYGTGSVDGLLANIGASELMSQAFSVDEIAGCCEKLGCSGLMIHLNGLQEFVQEEGNPHFSVSLDVLERFICEFPMPVWMKEVGSGLGGKCLKRLASLPIAGLELACRGGTSWVQVEAMRRQNPISPENIQALDSLGYSLKESIPVARQLMDKRTVIASGGISNALDLIKCLALGADLCAVAQPFYKVYHDHGVAALEGMVEEWISVGRLIWRSTGARDLIELRNIA